jgi:hypothetical protein
MDGIGRKIPNLKIPNPKKISKREKMEISKQGCGVFGVRCFQDLDFPIEVRRYFEWLFFTARMQNRSHRVLRARTQSAQRKQKDFPL